MSSGQRLVQVSRRTYRLQPRLRLQDLALAGAGDGALVRFGFSRFATGKQRTARVAVRHPTAPPNP